jgi:transposase InsO family protein
VRAKREEIPPETGSDISCDPLLACGVSCGFCVNHKKLYRIYKEERLTVRKRGGRKRAVGTRAPIGIPRGRNQRWSLDFVSHALSDGGRFRILTVVDDFTRECLALVTDTSLSGARVARELDEIIACRGRPAMIVSDNGTDVHLERDAELAGGNRCRLALHRASMRSMAWP